MIYVLDACAMIAYLRNEPGSTAVLKALIEAGSQSLAHALNLCEVFYDFHRKSDENIATEAINDLYSVGVVERTDLDEDFWMDVGRLKAQGKISLADCCAVVLTNRVGGTLLTSDHHELDRIAAAGVCSISFIR
jgi:PIN domain nuclease of toxin-antitoxin system